MEGRGAAGAQEADQRHDLACSGPGACPLHRNLTRLAKYTVDLYTNLEKADGDRLRRPGSLSIATNKELEEFQRGAAMLRGFDVIADRSARKEVKKKWPLLNVDDVIGAIYYPKDGKCNPAT